MLQPNHTYFNFCMAGIHNAFQGLNHLSCDREEPQYFTEKTQAIQPIIPTCILMFLNSLFSVLELGEISQKFLELWISTQHASRAGNQRVNLLTCQTE